MLKAHDVEPAAGTESDMLIRNAALGKALAAKLGKAPVALMRGHGATTIGRRLREAVYTAIYLEVNAKLHDIVSRAFEDAWHTRESRATSLRMASYGLAVQRVAEATTTRGLYP